MFKYLMEDERIARTILSALLKVEVVKVEVRPHEYSDDNRDTLSVFRIDDSCYGGDADMERILHRLTMAAADADLSKRCNSRPGDHPLGRRGGAWHVTLAIFRHPARKNAGIL